MRTIGIISRRPLFSHALSALISIHHDAETVWEIQGASELRAVPLEKRAVDVVVIDVGALESSNPMPASCLFAMLLPTTWFWKRCWLGHRAAFHRPAM
jgi:DNA-binding NarL/FixJ family response regulator